jgi:hypothetical protein
MFGAFVYGFRRFVAIRQLAGRDEGAEALILARSLLSIVARAVYVDAPEDLAERRMRYEQYLVKDLRDRLKMVEDLLATGFDVEDTRPALVPISPSLRSGAPRDSRRTSRCSGCSTFGPSMRGSTARAPSTFTFLSRLPSVRCESVISCSSNAAIPRSPTKP